MPERRHENDVGVGGIDDDAANHLAVAQPGETPGLSGISRFVKAIAGGDVAANVDLARTCIDDFGIRWRHGDGTDGGRGLGEIVP